MNSGTAVKALRKGAKNLTNILQLSTAVTSLQAARTGYTISNNAIELVFGPGETIKEIVMVVPIINAVQTKRRIYQGRMEYQVLMAHTKTTVLPIRVESLAFGANTIDVGSFNLFAAPITGAQEYNESSPFTWNVNANASGSTLTIRASLLNPSDSASITSLTVRAFLRGFYTTIG